MALVTGLRRKLSVKLSNMNVFVTVDTEILFFAIKNKLGCEFFDLGTQLLFRGHMTTRTLFFNGFMFSCEGKASLVVIER